ncbi:MAG: hypothetical protein COB53_04875 [Elusimicrobia bacterium]|nr:MAG: hypothetical protein COB53_04875 [Elusimicrobiota bacterium]
MKTFGTETAAEAKRLLASGKDANQISGILFQRDQAGRNYGIGIILDGRGKPAKTSTTLLRAAAKELKTGSALGTYMNSAKTMTALKSAVLAWQRIPKKFADRFHLALPSDAGTGAVKTALQAAMFMDSNIATLGLEALSWPAYKTMAKVLRLDSREFALGKTVKGRGLLPIYQAGPHNSTGLLLRRDEVSARAKAARGWIVLDRAYSGLEYASDLASSSYDSVMRRSYKNQIEPFIQAQTPFLLAISPTKSFGTFALRPCGLLLAYCPDKKSMSAAPTAFNAVMRARGSAFEHPITRAFVRAMLEDTDGLRRDHQRQLARVAAAERGWKRLAAGTALEGAFNGRYGGLFRNIRVQSGAAAALYGEHLYPVFTPGRCRLNITGLPIDAKLAAADAAALGLQALVG